MSDVIKLLPDSVANQIAAGEVIQRPASVIKELVENAVDAGAKHIQIILRDAGKTLIQVVDDGCGMSDTDARLAFERHATSKIRQAKDLFELHTMGFRGEALPSIVAVAQVDLRTMRREDRIGTHLEISASKFEGQTPEACAPGTNISVKNLFFNFPARRKFLKKDAVELTHIMHEFERLALVNPQLEFTLTHNEVTLHQLMPGSLKQRIASLFGRSLEKQLIPVETETPLVKISGFVSLPCNARRRNALQYFFANGRNMNHPYFRKAVVSCYEQLIAADQQPNYFLNFEVDPETIDVNIHPTKSEIKFENEQPIWQILQAAVRESLGKFNAVPAIDFNSTDQFEIPAFNPDATADHGLNIDTDYNPFDTTRKSPAPAQPETAPESLRMGSALSGSQRWEQARRSATSDWEKLYENFRKASSDDPDSYNPFDTSRDCGFDSPAAAVDTGKTPQRSTSMLNSLVSGLSADKSNSQPTLDGMADTTLAPVTGSSIMQIGDRYLLTPTADGALVVDRYRAHVKVLFERFMAMDKNDGGRSQQVLFPETVTLSPSENVILTSILDEAETVGFILEDLGDNSWQINGVPSSAGRLNPKDLLMKMIESVGSGMEDGAEKTAEAIRRQVSLAMARSAAVRPGDTYSAADSEHLLAALFSLPDPQYTPDGNKIMFVIPVSFFESNL